MCMLSHVKHDNMVYANCLISHSQSDVRVKSLLLGRSQHELVYGLCKLHKLASWNSPGVPTLHLLNTFSSWLNDPRLLAYSKSLRTMEKQLQFKRKSGFLFALSQMRIWTCFLYYRCNNNFIYAYLNMVMLRLGARMHVVKGMQWSKFAPLDCRGQDLHNKLCLAWVSQLSPCKSFGLNGKLRNVSALWG